MADLKNMRVGIWALASMLIFLGFLGCKHAGTPTCSKNADCRITVNGTEALGVCVMGKCEECVEHADCSGLRQCINNRCEQSCSADADCGPKAHCDGSLCAPNCEDSVACAENETCEKGRCLAQGESPGGEVLTTLEQCASDFKVFFDFDKSNVKPEYQSSLNRAAKCLAEHPEEQVNVEGHTDRWGTTSYNMALGERRANSVANVLKSQEGVADNRMTIVSLGPNQPLEVGNDAKNRRSEIKFKTR